MQDSSIDMRYYYGIDDPDWAECQSINYVRITNMPAFVKAFLAKYPTVVSDRIPGGIAIYECGHWHVGNHAKTSFHEYTTFVY